MFKSSRRPVGRVPFPLAVLALCLGVWLMSPQTLAGQRSVLTVKREALTPRVGGCPELPPLPEPEQVGGDARSEAASLAGSARQAAIIGDEDGAHDLLARAAALNPLEGSVAYLLARSHEARGEEAEALVQYCQYLRVESNAPDAGQVQRRIEELAPPPESTVPERALRAYRNGLVQFDLGRLDLAEREFTDAVRVAPDFGEAYFNRGVVYAAQERHALAAQNLERYLEVTPDAADETMVGRWVDLLRAPMVRYSPNAALAAGLVVPGGGQFYTRRPGMGAAFLAGAIGAVAFGYYSEEIQVVCEVPPTNGQCPPDQVLDRNSTRPYLGAAIGVATAVAIYGAVDAYLTARRRNRLARSVIRVEGGGLRTSLRLGVPAPAPVRGGVGVELFRLSF